jgi:16S rRNA (cytidine1402-2'-O)-methyltransferase
MPSLYVVGTPIGNLGDFSPRAAEVLAAVDFIAAEDTRVTLKLLNHFGIKKPMVSYHEHNLRERGQMIVGRILAGEDCAVVSDAGMPCISDPGEDLVRICAAEGIPVIVIPGPSAAVSALAVSGLVTSRFTFEGFLSVNKVSRREHLQSLEHERRTMIFYEAPHKLPGTLEDLRTVFGGARKISIVKELTKVHEQVLRTDLDGAVEAIAEKTPKGEYVLVVEGLPEGERETPLTLEEAVLLACSLAEGGMRASDAAREAAKASSCSKAEIYRGMLDQER